MFRRRLEPLFEEDTESSSDSENDDNDETMARDYTSSDQVGFSKHNELLL